MSDSRGIWECDSNEDWTDETEQKWPSNDDCDLSPNEKWESWKHTCKEVRWVMIQRDEKDRFWQETERSLAGFWSEDMLKQTYRKGMSGQCACSLDVGVGIIGLWWQCRWGFWKTGGLVGWERDFYYVIVFSMISQSNICLYHSKWLATR